MRESGDDKEWVLMWEDCELHSVLVLSANSCTQNSLFLSVYILHQALELRDLIKSKTDCSRWKVPTSDLHHFRKEFRPIHGGLITSTNGYYPGKRNWSFMSTGDMTLDIIQGIGVGGVKAFKFCLWSSWKLLIYHFRKHDVRPSWLWLLEDLIPVLLVLSHLAWEGGALIDWLQLQNLRLLNRLLGWSIA